jgi:hypothetical protein
MEVTVIGLGSGNLSWLINGGQGLYMRSRWCHAPDIV